MHASTTVGSRYVTATCTDPTVFVCIHATVSGAQESAEAVDNGGTVSTGLTGAGVAVWAMAGSPEISNADVTRRATADREIQRVAHHGNGSETKV